MTNLKPFREPGKRRRARLVKRDYWVQVTDQETGAETWHRVTRALQITAPLGVTRLYLANDDEFGMSADDLVMARTPTEHAKAVARLAKADA